MSQSRHSPRSCSYFTHQKPAQVMLILHTPETGCPAWHHDFWFGEGGVDLALPPWTWRGLISPPPALLKHINININLQAV